MDTITEWEWRLRTAGPADIEPIAELKAVVMRADLTRLGRFGEERCRRIFREGFAPGFTSVIELAGAFAGSLTLRPHQRGGREIAHFYLDPAVQGRGLGGEILRSVLADCDARGLPVRLTVLQGSAARRFYERHGFALESEDPIDVHMLRPPAGG
ncbi:GNAT family N-acetyltransferase [Streptomyces sp. NPDC089919]|uniref:GNAT family N-acetyltransferase n=1 Tax=Streptomyces sp. NPDC089919 TaxID=3155188 RepID=UPI0034339405